MTGPEAAAPLRHVRAVGLLVFGLLLVHGQAAGKTPEAEDAPAAPAADMREGPAAPCIEPCDKEDPDELIDRIQEAVYMSVSNAADWFDGLFGNPRFEQDRDDTFGRVNIFQTWDDRDNFDTRLGLRVRLALPAMQNRLRLTLGRGDEQELIEERPSNTENPLPPSFRRVDDESWLLGLGYSQQSGARSGFDVGTGIRLRTPLDPYVRGSYRHNWVFDTDTMLRFRETLFWRNSLGFGATTQITLDHLLTSTLLTRWNNVGTIAEETNGLDWGSSLTLYQSLSNRRALSYTALVRGQTVAEVGLQDWGAEIRYRQRVLRQWLFVEFATSVTWPRETLDERRQINPGVGIGFEMYFGPVPDELLR
ncbi:MAG: hypothetical protein JJT85_03795 [Chromatiales bacterium]|nr:hypothetical protein [Chromatiales bacterium]